MAKALGDPDAQAHAGRGEPSPVVDAARTLGCATIRVNAQSARTPEEQEVGCRRIAPTGHIAAPMNLNVIVGNHGGLVTR
jgi:hypothetical protein